MERRINCYLLSGTLYFFPLSFVKSGGRYEDVERLSQVNIDDGCEIIGRSLRDAIERIRSDETEVLEIPGEKQVAQAVGKKTYMAFLRSAQHCFVREEIDKHYSLSAGRRDRKAWRLDGGEDLPLDSTNYELGDALKKVLQTYDPS